MARRASIGQGDGDDDVNVTPLLDIVFIMLIFFIVTSTFVKEPGIDPLRPEVQTGKDKRFGTILVAISADNKIWIDKKEVELSEIKLFVEQTKRENPRATAVVQSDVDANSKTMVEVINRIRDAGMNDIAVSTEDS